MIVDCFTFFNEFDLLELRLQTLEDVVDRFVLCEAPFTFRGEPKPLLFETQLGRYERWRDRIVHLTYPRAAAADPWVNEWGQRDFLATALAACSPDDLILIGDCDELPAPQFAARRPAAGGILAHRMYFMMGFVNRAWGDPNPSWIGTRAIAYGDIAAYGGLSDVRKQPTPALETIDSGWHFTSLGGAATMEQKMRSYSHRELDVPYFRDRRRLDVELAETEGFRLPVDERFPHSLRTDPAWRHLILAESGPALDAEQKAALEHAHGCFAYVPGDAPSVAVIGAGDAWTEAGTARFGARFAGTFEDADALRAAQTPAWIVLDGLERHPADILRRCAARGASVVAYATNARSLAVFEGVIAGSATFPAGRAAGRAEFDAVIGAAGYRPATADRVFNRAVSIPRAVAAGYGVTVAGFRFPRLEADALLDFLTTGWVFVLGGEEPERPATEAPMSDPESIKMTVPVVTVTDLTLPRWMTPYAKQLFAIPTHLTLQERLTLLQVSLGMPPGFSAVEIGSYLGASTAFLGFAALQKAGFVHAIDPWTNDAMGAEGERDTWTEFRKNTAPFDHYIVPHKGFSADVHAGEAPIACDLLFIDGDHSYDAVVLDLRCWLPSLRPGGVLAMHDIDSPDVKRAFDTVVGAATAAQPQVVDRLLVCRPSAAGSALTV